MTGRILWATKIGAPEWQEELITEQDYLVDAASEWALVNGFDRLRVATIDETAPVFGANLLTTN